MYTLLVTGDVPGAASYFNPLLQQTIIPCTSGTRPSSPATGWCIYETDTKLFREYDSTLALWVPYANSGNLTWTPALTAATGNPTLGTGNVRTGKYAWSPGGFVTASWYIQFGTSGTGAGTGQYQISLPVAAAVDRGGTAQEADGIGKIFDFSTSSNFPTMWYIPGSLATVAVGVACSSNSVVNNTTPMAWGVSDHISGTITYRAVVP